MDDLFFVSVVSPFKTTFAHEVPVDIEEFEGVVVVICNGKRLERVTGVPDVAFRCDGRCGRRRDCRWWEHGRTFVLVSQGAQPVPA